MKRWRCKLCGAAVLMDYDHPRSCSKGAIEDACVGTFIHPLHSICENTALLFLSHALVTYGTNREHARRAGAGKGA